MSHRVTINTEFSDRRALERALKANNWSYSTLARRINIDQGPGAGGHVDLDTGKFHGDTDFHDVKKLGPLTQAYGEALWMNRIADDGGYLESRTVLQDGTIRLVGTVVG